MNDRFDELAKGMAQFVTRRGALKRFGVGLAGIALAMLGLADKTEAQDGNRRIPDGLRFHCRCKEAYYGCNLQAIDAAVCLETCANKCGP